MFEGQSVNLRITFLLCITKKIVPFEDPMSTKVGEIFLDIISIEEDFESNLDEELPICQN